MRIDLAMQAKIANIISPAPRNIWSEIYQADPEAVPYQSPNWTDCICEANSLEDISRLYEMEDGRQIVLPLIKRNIVGPLITSAGSLSRHWGMGGVLCAGGARPEEVTAILEDLEKLPYIRVRVRPNPRTNALWEAAVQPMPDLFRVPRYAHVIDLRGGFDKVWDEQFTKGTRSHIRKAERAGVTVECDTEGKLIPVFYELFMQSLIRWAKQQHEPLFLARFRAHLRDPLSKLENMSQKMGGKLQVWVARVDGEPAAASIVLFDKNVNDIRNAMNKELSSKTSANDLILKFSIEEACKNGCQYYHLGESGTSKGLATFKTRFGAEGYSYSEYHLQKFQATRIDYGLRKIVKTVVGFRD